MILLRIDSKCWVNPHRIDAVYQDERGNIVVVVNGDRYVSNKTSQELREKVELYTRE